MIWEVWMICSRRLRMTHMIIKKNVCSHHRVLPRWYNCTMQFQVPQFIEVEDKIFGPLTFRQFVYIGGGLGASYIVWRILPIYFSAPLILCVGGLAAALAFFQFNGRPFILALENAFFFLLRTKLYLWNNAPKKAAASEAPVP